MAPADSAELDSAIDSAKKELKTAEQARAAKDPKRAREVVGAAIDRLLALRATAASRKATDALLELGISAYGVGDVRHAMSAWNATLEYRERELDPDSREVQSARLDVATAALALGDVARAKALLETVVEVRTRLLPDDDPDLQKARSNLGIVLLRLEDAQGARALGEKVLEVRTRTLPDDHPDLQSARMNLASALEVLGDRARATSLLQKVVEVYAHEPPPDEAIVQRARGNLAAVLSSAGDFARARSIQEEVLTFFARTLPDDHPDLQIAREKLALTLESLGDLRAARVLFEKVLAVRTSTLPDDNLRLQSARGNVASVLLAMGDCEAAAALYRRVIDSLSRTSAADDRELLSARQGLATASRISGDVAGARAIEESVLAARLRKFGDDDLVVQRTRLNLANAIGESGDWKTAREMYKQLLATELRTLPRDHPRVLLVRQALALATRMLGNVAESRASMEEVVAARERIAPDDDPGLARDRRTLAWAAAALGDRARVRELLVEIARGVSGGIAEIALVSSREARARLASSNGDVSGLLSLSALLDPPDRQDGAIFALIESMRAASCAPAVAERDLDPADREPLEAAKRARTALADAINSASDAVHSPTPEIVHQRIAERDATERALRERWVLRGVITPSIDAASLARALPLGSVAVGIRVYQRVTIGSEPLYRLTSTPALIAFVLDSEGVLQRVDLGSLAPIAASVGRWRSAIGKPIERGLAASSDVASAERDAAHELRSAVLDPLVAASKGAREWFVCVDDALHLVPLDALIDVDQPSQARLRIHLESSFAELVQPRKPSDRAQSFVALGGADFNAVLDGPSGNAIAASAPTEKHESVELDRAGPLRTNLAPLAETRAEVENLGELFRETFQREPNVMIGKKATKSALEAAASGARVLHIATHGWFAPELANQAGSNASDLAGSTAVGVGDDLATMAPMTLCGLALAGANRGVDSIGRVPGVITAEEIASLDLSNCELAVLSACDTNVGIARAGQGIQSLQGALHAAGVRTAITSLWKVDDEATRELFEDFYTRVWVHGEKKSDALSAAKSALKQRGRPTRDWAAWILTGSPN